MGPQVPLLVESREPQAPLEPLLAQPELQPQALDWEPGSELGWKPWAWPGL